MALTGIEPVIDELIAYLRANLAARVVAVAAEAPVLTMPAPEAADFYFGGRQTYPKYPAIALVPAPSVIKHDRTDRMAIDHTVALGIYVTDPDEETLTRLLLRYARAVMEVIVSGRIAKAFSFQPDFEGQTVDPSPVRVADDALFERDLSLAIRCWKEEVR